MFYLYYTKENKKIVKMIGFRCYATTFITSQYDECSKLTCKGEQLYSVTVQPKKYMVWLIHTQEVSEVRTLLIFCICNQPKE